MEKISSLSPNLLDETLKGIKNGALKSICQDNNCATFCKKMKKEEKIIDWNMEAQALHNKIRGMYQLNTNHTTFDNKKAYKARLKSDIAYLKNKINEIKKGIGNIKIVRKKSDYKPFTNTNEYKKYTNIDSRFLMLI